MMGTEDELTPVTRPSGLYRDYIASEIKKILLSEDVLIKILVDWYGHPTFIKQDWGQYWSSVTPLLPPACLNILENLRIARKQYILERFSHSAMISYCFNYFCLLEEVLDTLKNVCDGTAKSILLSKVLGFENFIIGWADGTSGLACGTL